MPPVGGGMRYDLALVACRPSSAGARYGRQFSCTCRRSSRLAQRTDAPQETEAGPTIGEWWSVANWLRGAVSL